MATEVLFPQDVSTEFFTPFIQGGEDTVQVKRILMGDGSNGVRGIGLETPNEITWEKQLRMLDANGVEISSVGTKDANHGPHFMAVTGDSRSVEFVKAKIFGVMTGMYVMAIPNFSQNPGYRLLFRWQRDG